MKKIYLVTSLAFASFACAAQGGFQGPKADLSQNLQGGFKGPSKVSKYLVSDLKNMPEDSFVRLEGSILESLGNEEYRFQDQSGDLIIEVDHDDWNGLTVLPETPVIIEGEVEVERGELQVEVEHIQLSQ